MHDPDLQPKQPLRRDHANGDARRCSDVDDAATAIAILAGAGLLEIEDGAVRVVRIEQHIPPPHLRDENRKHAQRERKRRQRLHAKGDHSTCLAGECPKVVPHGVTGDVTRDVGTGQDGTGRGSTGAVTEARDDEDHWPSNWETVAAGYDR